MSIISISLHHETVESSMSDTMALEQKKRAQKPVEKPRQSKGKDGIPDTAERSDSYQFSLRFSDVRLARAVRASSGRNRRSMNQEILFILEDSMRLHGD